MWQSFKALMLVLALSLAAPALAGPYEDGQAAYSRADYAAAMRIWRPHAEQGNALAQRSLGALYAIGHGVPQDYAQAATWLRRAAEQGDARAQIHLGSMYTYGRGVPQDYARAATWLRRAAEQGAEDAQFDLGFMYFDGRGVPQDYVRAHMWFNLSAANGNAGATEARTFVASKMTPNQIAEAQKLAREWKAK